MKLPEGIVFSYPTSELELASALHQDMVRGRGRGGGTGKGRIFECRWLLGRWGSGKHQMSEIKKHDEFHVKVKVHNISPI